MAYQTRGREPLLDSTTQAAIEKRGKELIGMALIGIAVLSTMMMATYTPDDPNWMLASDAPVQNWLGRFGASISHPLFMIIGQGAWLFPLIFAAWGLRLIGHWGEERALGRVIFAPIAVAVAAIYAATLAPGPTWDQTYGLGGLFGDTVLGMLLTALPIGVGFAAKLLSLITGVVVLALTAFALGFTTQELKLALRWFLYGLVMAYAIALAMLGRSASVGMKVAQATQSRVGDHMAHRRAEAEAARRRAAEEAAAERLVPPPQSARRSAAVVRPAGAPATSAPKMPPGAMAEARPMATPATKMPPVAARAASVPAEPPMTGRQMPPEASLMAPASGLSAPARPAPPEARGFLSSLLRRSEPAPVHQPQVATLPADAPPGDRIKARISDAIRARSQAAAPAPVEPPVTRPRKPVALILDTKPKGGLPPEPPLKSSAVPQPARLFPAAPDWPTEVIDTDEAEQWDAYPEPELPEPSASHLFQAAPQTVSAPPQPAPRATPAEPRRATVQHAAKAPAPSSRARAEAQPKLPLEEKFADYEYPPLSLLASPEMIERHHLSDEALAENARMLESVLDDYGVKGEIVSVRPGPVVTMYELEPAPGLKASRVIGLADDIARSMSALSARVSTVPGRSVIGIELPNEKREKVVLREILSARDFGDSQMRLPLALGKDISGEPIVANLAKMPHLLIAGTTGSGKSVAINTMILSLLYKLTPEECRLIMIDPKMLELSVYDGIPHLLSPVVTDPKKAVVALKWVVGEMEERYRKMSKMGVRNIEGYNGRVREALKKGETFDRTVQTGFDEETGDPIFETEEITPELLPYIVVIVDEMADLMMVAGKEIEACIQRLAQMARASGIHLIMATQRPSVDVITGTIKANFPTRISFQVTSKIDSRTILGEMGAEQLLGMGDMLYMAGGSRITRVHGPFCSDEEVEEIVNYLKGFGPPDYVGGVVEGPDEERENDIDAVLGLSGSGGAEGDDALYDMAVQIVARDRKCSTSYIQRKLAIGYNKAARLVEQMEDEGVVSSANHVGKREVLVPEVH